MISDSAVPHLVTSYQSTLPHLERIILTHVATIEAWFRKEWQLTSPLFSTSVDLRHSGLKIAPVDTNLFPAGFNNISIESLPLCVQAVETYLMSIAPKCTKVLLIPELHTRNQFYADSLSILKTLLEQAGYVVCLGHVNGDGEVTLTSSKGETLIVYPFVLKNQRLIREDFEPCTIILNNDLSSGIPPVLEGIKQTILPLPDLGWAKRLKSVHFDTYKQVAAEFADAVGFDPWLITPYSTAVADLDFMALKGMDRLEAAVADILAQTTKKYAEYGIKDKPFVAVKADNGTYGMSIMMVDDPATIRTLNRKMRTKMAAGKGGITVNQVIVQEGVYTFETMESGSVAEPVVYMLGRSVVGGFYRVHKERGVSENLNAPGMEFEPIAFSCPCNLPRCDLHFDATENRFYIFGVIARLAALAAAREQQHILRS